MSKSEQPPNANVERAYLNPPVVEAFCEVFFAESNWDNSVPEKLFKEFRQEFPIRQERTFHEANVTVDNQGADAELISLPSWDVFLTEERDQLIQISNKHISFNQLRPYRPFLEWENYFYDALSLYEQVVSPQAVERVGVRYINHIEIPEQSVSMQEYFKIYPLLPQGLGNSHGSFLTAYDIPLDLDRIILTITFNSLSPDPPITDRQFFLLDLHYKALIGVPLDKSDLIRTIRIAHNQVVQAFEGSITDNLRELFNERNSR